MRRKVSPIWTEEEMLKLRSLLPNSALSRVNNPHRCPDPEYREVWPHLTLGERAFLIVFWGAFRRNNFNNLLALYRGDRVRARAALESADSDRAARRRDAVAITPAQVMKDLCDRLRKRVERDTEDAPYRHHGWLREDVASEALNRDLEPMLGPARHDPIRLTEQAPPPGPVRQISIEEYEATKQQPKKGDTHLSFLPKVIVKKSDKYIETSDSDHEEWYDPDPRTTMAGYDDPRREDEPYNPRYTPE